VDPPGGTRNEVHAQAHDDGTPDVDLTLPNDVTAK
jgi:hypothetical protein